MAMASNPYVPPEADVLYALQQLFLPLITRAPDAVVVCNADGQIILVNPQVERWFGYTPQELYGQPLTMLVPERFRSAPLAQWTHSLAAPRDQTAIVLPLAGRRKQGEEFPLDMSLSSLLLEHELFVVGILRDTVAHAQEDAASQHTELLVILGQLAATVSHEIRNPLQSLSLHLELLEEELQPRGAVAEFFALMKVDLARVHSVVEDYLSLARVPNVRRTAVAVDALLEAIAQEHQPRMAAQAYHAPSGRHPGPRPGSAASLHVSPGDAQPSRQCPGRDARGRPAHLGGPADSLPPGGVGTGYRGRDACEAAATAVYALIYDEVQRHRLGPVCGARDCQSPWRHGGSHEYTRRRDDLHPPVALDACGRAHHLLTIACGLSRCITSCPSSRREIKKSRQRNEALPTLPHSG